MEFFVANYAICNKIGGVEASFQVEKPVKINSDSTELTFTICIIMEHYKRNVQLKQKSMLSGT